GARCSTLSGRPPRRPSIPAPAHLIPSTVDPGTGMTGSSAPSFDSVESVLRDSGAGTDAAEVHGTLCGLMCMLGPAARPSWIAGVLDPTDPSRAHAAVDLLDTLAV